VTPAVRNHKPCNPMNGYQRFALISCLSLQGRHVIYAEGIDSET
jgi:hypothetical protein